MIFPFLTKSMANGPLSYLKSQILNLFNYSNQRFSCDFRLPSRGAVDCDAVQSPIRNKEAGVNNNKRGSPAEASVCFWFGIFPSKTTELLAPLPPAACRVLPDAAVFLAPFCWITCDQVRFLAWGTRARVVRCLVIMEVHRQASQSSTSWPWWLSCCVQLQLQNRHLLLVFMKEREKERKNMRCNTGCFWL